MFYLIGSCKWFEEENIMKFLLNRNSVVKKVLGIPNTVKPAYNSHPWKMA